MNLRPEGYLSTYRKDNPSSPPGNKVWANLASTHSETYMYQYVPLNVSPEPGFGLQVVAALSRPNLGVVCDCMHDITVGRSVRQLYKAATLRRLCQVCWYLVPAILQALKLRL